MTAPAPGTVTPFDSQAGGFERRAGLLESDCRAIAAAVVEMAGVGAGDHLVEIGAGTGMIGRWFVEHPLHYLGLDLSRGMLEVFRRRWRSGVEAAPGVARGALAQADASRPWPLASGAARAVFSSRAIHLLPLDLVVEELFRIAAADGAACVLGWVERRPDSVKGRLAREMRRRLRGRGFDPRGAGSRPVVEACRRRGAQELSKTAVARWPAHHTPRQALDDWRSKLGLGGVVLPPGVQEEVLAELEDWAAEVFGGLDVAVESEECYVLEGVRWRTP